MVVQCLLRLGPPRLLFVEQALGLGFKGVQPFQFLRFEHSGKKRFFICKAAFREHLLKRLRQLCFPGLFLLTLFAERGPLRFQRQALVMAMLPAFQWFAGKRCGVRILIRQHP